MGGARVRNEVPISLLKSHPKNAEYFSPPSSEEREVLKHSIAVEGIRDPLKVTPDYTVVAGHLRLEVAKELGMEKVPVVIVDGDPEYLEYLLIADNEERRYCRDPIKKAKRAEFLKRYWRLREGSANPKGTVVSREVQNAPDERKTLADVAEALGESVDSVKRLLKLNDLIPELQALVSQGRLFRTAAYSLAFLPPGEQRHLLDVLGESGVCGLSVKEAQDLRRQLESVRAEAEALREQVDNLRERSEETERLRARLKELERRPVEKVVEKVVYRADPAVEAELEAARKQAADLLRDKEWLQSRLQALAEEKEQKEARVRALEEQADQLQRMLDQASKELEKEKSRPKPPQLSKEHTAFRALMERATDGAVTLAAALAEIEAKHADRLRAAARVRGTPGDELKELVEVVEDAFAFNAFKAALDAAGGRTVRVLQLLEPKKPALHLIRGGVEKGDSDDG